MFDTHAHLTDPAFDLNRKQVIQNARTTGVKYIIAVGYDFMTSRASLELARAESDIFAAVGIHPHSAGEEQDDWVEIEKLAIQPEVVAIGETGLDYYRDYAPHDLQKRLFKRHITLARKLNKPLIIHTRKSYDDALAILKEEDCHFGVFHCFSGDANFARQVIKQGFYVSFSGSITYDGHKLKKVAVAIPQERILIETDCPYLAPEPLKGQRNEPAYVKFIAQKLAEIFSQPVKVIAEQTTRNAINLFGIK